MRILALVPFLWSAPALAGTSVTLSSMSVNGMELRDVTCELTTGGMFASMAVTAEIANQKPAYDACRPEGGAFSMSWTWADGKTTDATVKASSHEPANGCMITALSAIESSQSGTCTATLLVGDAAGAASAYPLVPSGVAPAEQPPEN